jgi:putative DNA primase/helicase
VEFLRDLTGNSRWWVIPCLKIDYQHTIDMQQVFAEYLGVYREGYQWWLTPEEEKRLDEQSASFQVEDPLKSRMDYHYDFEDGVERDLKVTSHEIFMEIGIDNPTRADSMKLGQLLKARSIRKGRSGAGNVYVNMPMKRRERR